MATDTCVICGGDGRIANSFGSITSCPSCHGGGRRLENTGIRDVTKTKPSHFKDAEVSAKKQDWPATADGDRLGKEVIAAGGISSVTKARLVRDIIDHESTHGRCTETFAKKLRRQLRP